MRSPVPVLRGPRRTRCAILVVARAWSSETAEGSTFCSGAGSQAPLPAEARGQMSQQTRARRERPARGGGSRGGEHTRVCGRCAAGKHGGRCSRERLRLGRPAESRDRFGSCPALAPADAASGATKRRSSRERARAPLSRELRYRGGRPLSPRGPNSIVAPCRSPRAPTSQFGLHRNGTVFRFAARAKRKALQLVGIVPVGILGGGKCEYPASLTFTVPVAPLLDISSSFRQSILQKLFVTISRITAHFLHHCRHV